MSEQNCKIKSTYPAPKTPLFDCEAVTEKTYGSPYKHSHYGTTSYEHPRSATEYGLPYRKTDEYGKGIVYETKSNSNSPAAKPESTIKQTETVEAARLQFPDKETLKSA